MANSSKGAWRAAVASGLVLFSATTASANDVGGAIVGGIIGGIIGGAIANGGRHHRSDGGPVRVYRERERERPANSERTRKIQEALAFFGLYQGGIDGRMGPGTRQAIVALQQKMNWPATGELSDEQYRALLAVYAERTAPGGGPSPAGNSPSARSPDALIEAINRSTPPAPVAPTEPAKVVPTPSVAPTTLVSAPLPGATAPVSVTTIRYSNVCIGAMALKSASDNDLTRRIKDHVCAALAESTAEISRRLSDPRFSDVGALSDQCKALGLSIRAELSADEAPQASVDRLRDKLRALTAEQRASAAEGYAVCAGFGLSSNTLEYVNTAAVALAALNEPRYLEFLAAQAVLGIDEASNTAKGADWYEVAANSPVPLVQLSSPDADRQARTDFFKSVASELRQPANRGAQTQYLAGLIPKFNPAQKPAVADTPQLGAAPGGTKFDGPSNKPMSHADLVDFIRPSIVIIYAPNNRGASLGTGYFIAPNLILTNTHVVQESEREVVVANKTLGARVARIVAKGMTRDNKGLDAAILQMNGAPSPSFLKVSQNIREGQAIAIGGFPGRAQDGHDKAYGDFLAILSGQRIPTSDTIPAPKFDFGFVQALVTNPQDNMHNIQIGVNTTHGNSGSPVVDSCGNAVGLDYEGSVASLQVVRDGSGFKAMGDSSQFSYALRMDEVVKFLDTLRSPYTEATARCAE